MSVDTYRQPDGHWVFTATDGENKYTLVHPEKFTPFTEQQKHAMTCDAAGKFAGRA